MTPVQLAHERVPQSDVDVNLGVTFAVLLILPYALFFGLLMLVTGEPNLALLYDAVTAGRDMVVVKAWIIGFFVLSVVAAAVLTAYRTERYVAEHLSPAPRKRQHGSRAAEYFVIESDDAAETPEEAKARHAGLERVVGTDPR